MITGTILATSYVALYLTVKSKKARFERQKEYSGSLNVDKEWLVKFSESSLMKFAVAGSLGALAYWSEQDWGAWLPVMSFFIAQAKEYIDSLNK